MLTAAAFVQKDLSQQQNLKTLKSETETVTSPLQPVKKQRLNKKGSNIVE